MPTQALATKIVQKLRNEGFIAYFAGGWVRDLLLGCPSDDIDIATNASPENIVEIFPKTIQVGISFGVVVVQVNGHAFEVASFRKDIDSRGRHPQRIEAASPEEDAKRRDFTINGMFYDPLSETIHDFVGGQEDLQRGMIRTIGNPNDRFFEDRLRMIRAVRFAARFGFHVEPETEKAIKAQAPTLFPSVSIERVWDEFRKMAKTDHLDYGLIELHRLELLQEVFPSLKGTHLNKIKKHVSIFKKFPKNSPTIAFLLELFPEINDDQVIELCRTLKTSKKDLQFALFIRHGKRLFLSGQQEPYTWCQFYAHPDAHRCMGIFAASLAEEKRKSFFEEHQKREKSLGIHIKRIQTKKPLLQARHLKEKGVAAGKKMGRLLVEGERLTANLNLTSCEEILEKLAESEWWPTE